MLTVRPASLDDPAVIALVEAHNAFCEGSCPSGSNHVLALDSLRHPSVTVLAAWQGDRLAGIGALKDLGGGHGEIKSMHTAEGMRGLGAGRAILHALMEEAQGRGYGRLSLETGTETVFTAARGLYEAHGFAPCPPFGHYTADPNSLYMTATLQAEARP